MRIILIDYTAFFLGIADMSGFTCVKRLRKAFRVPFHALGGSWRQANAERPFFVRRAKTRRFNAGSVTKHIGQNAHACVVGWFVPNAPGRHRTAAVADVFGAYINGEGCLTCLTPDPACAACRRDSWSDGRGQSLASAPRVAAGIGESSLMLLVTCYTDYILILY